MITEIITIQARADFDRAVERACDLLSAGDVVVLPTETVYGLAGNAFDSSAVRKIFEIKGRPPGNPLIVHIASWDVAQQCAATWPEEAEILARAFWPGPLTLVLPKTKAVPDVVTAGGSTVALRWPAHPLMQAILQRLGKPLAAPSANLSGQTSPTQAAHVVKDLNGKIPLIIDAGPAAVGIESTVVDLSCGSPTILRPGIISSDQLSQALNRTLPLNSGKHSGEELKSPGLLAKHYAPHARVVVADWRSEAEFQDIAGRLGYPLTDIHVIAHSVIPGAQPFGRVVIIPCDPQAYARAIYAEFHQCDALGAKAILVETPPSGPEWEAIRDRLTRAGS